LNHKSCEGCLFSDQCRSQEDCEFYSPIDEDDAMNEYIEQGRAEFLDDWLDYISQAAV
jgi:hypothetical protein